MRKVSHCFREVNKRQLFVAQSYEAHRWLALEAYACTKLERPHVRDPRLHLIALQWTTCWMHWSAADYRFGPVVKALSGYIEKMEAVYAAKRTLFRGMRLPEQHLQDNYAVGKIISWHAFSSVTTNRHLAESYYSEDYDRGFFLESGVPVLFMISTHFRGALLGGWSPHTTHDELLLSPFLFFRVTSISELSGNDRLRVWSWA